MKRGVTYAVAGLAGLAFVLVSGTYLFEEFLDAECVNTSVKAETSPDGVFKAILFERNCGTTMGYSSQLSIIDVERRLPNESGNIFIADLPNGGRAAAWGGPYVEFTWRDKHALDIRYDAQARVFKNVPKLGAVTITYATE